MVQRYSRNLSRRRKKANVDISRKWLVVKYVVRKEVCHRFYTLEKTLKILPGKKEIFDGHGSFDQPRIRNRYMFPFMWYTLLQYISYNSEYILTLRLDTIAMDLAMIAILSD